MLENMSAGMVVEGNEKTSIAGSELTIKSWQGEGAFCKNRSSRGGPQGIQGRETRSTDGTGERVIRQKRELCLKGRKGRIVKKGGYDTESRLGDSGGKWGGGQQKQQGVTRGHWRK